MAATKTANTNLLANQEEKNAFWPAFLEVGISHLAHEWIFDFNFSVPRTLL